MHATPPDEAAEERARAFSPPSSACDSGIDTAGESEPESQDEPDTEDEVEDATSWRRRQEGRGGDESGAIDPRVAGAFDGLNKAIAQNNEVELAYSETQRKLQQQRKDAQASLALLEKKHSRDLRKLERYRSEQAAAQAAALALREVSAQLETALSELEAATETLALQRDGLTMELGPSGWQANAEQLAAQSDEWRVVEAALQKRCADAERAVQRLTREHCVAAAEDEKRAKRVLDMALALGEVLSAALPYLDEQASVEFEEASLERSLRERGEETARAKATVKRAMSDLERISLEIMRQQAVEGAAAHSAATQASETHPLSAQYEAQQVAEAEATAAAAEAAAVAEEAVLRAAAEAEAARWLEALSRRAEEAEGAQPPAAAAQQQQQQPPPPLQPTPPPQQQQQPQQPRQPQQRTPSPSSKLKRADAFARGTASGRHASRRQSFFGEHTEERPAMSSIDFDTVLPTW